MCHFGQVRRRLQTAQDIHHIVRLIDDGRVQGPRTDISQIVRTVPNDTIQMPPWPMVEVRLNEILHIVDPLLRAKLHRQMWQGWLQVIHTRAICPKPRCYEYWSQKAITVREMVSCCGNGQEPETSAKRSSRAIIDLKPSFSLWEHLAILNQRPGSILQPDASVLLCDVLCEGLCICAVGWTQSTAEFL